MEIIGAAALIAVGIVAAAVLYGRAHGMGAGATAARPPVAGAAAVEVELPERTAAVAQREAGLARRETELARREAELEKEREGAMRARQDLERTLERVSGLSAARAKQMLLKEIEDQSQARRRQADPPDRRRNQAGRRTSGAKHPLGMHAAPRRRARRRDHGLGRPALDRRHEGPDHRP